VIVFSVICALLIVLALASILPPLRRPDRIAIGSTTIEANVAVYRGELAEMESDLHHRIMTNEQFVLDREELEKRLIVDLPKESRASRQERPALGSEMLIYGLAVGVPLTAILLYLAIGAPLSLLQSP
jgi:cytochrome c-type biogenesis protein CcmH